MPLVILLMLVSSCKQVSDVSASDLRGQSMERLLWQKLIGRQMTPEEQEKYTGLGYRQTLDAILASQAYIEEGFFHLHRQRLLLHFTKGSTEEELTFTTLRMELADVARSDNYWDILTYRDRWFDARFTPLIPYYCRMNTDDTMNDRQQCETKLKQELIKKAVEDRAKCDNPALQTKLVHYDRAYERLFGFGYCEAAGQPLPRTWNDDDLGYAVSFLRSYIFSSGFDYFLEYVELDRRKIGYNPVKRKPIEVVKLRLPDHANDSLDLHGIHGNSFWLSKFSTTPLNQHLHRAKIIWYSWFCQHIAPDNANNSIPKNEADMNAEELAKWKKFQRDILAVQEYFAANDIHAIGDRVCFNCHRELQPVANYFGRLSMRDRDAAGTKWSGLKGYFEHDAPHDRPGGVWQTEIDAIVPASIGAGLPGLANMLRNLPKVHRCIVKSSWDHFFGSAYALSEEETAAGVKAFASSNFNYRSLLKHLLGKKEAEAYFVEGEQKFHDMRSSKAMTCEKAMAQGKIDAVKIVSSLCDDCHRKDAAHVDDFVEDGSLTRLDEIYRAVFSEESTMPKYDDFLPSEELDLEELDQPQANDIQRKILECELKAKGIDPQAPEKTEEERLAQQGHLVNGQAVRP